jgi:hypothetical protein
MFHGDRETRNSASFEGHRLGPTAYSFRTEGMEPVPCVYNDLFADEVKDQLLGLDGVQVWVNPVTEDGHSREVLDDLLRSVAAKGVFVSSHPDMIQKIGTKNVLFDTREMGWVGDVQLYRTLEEMQERLPGLLDRSSRVLKKHRGHSGQGIWRLTSAGSDRVKVKPAARGTAEEEMSISHWVESCRPYFEGGPMLDQEYNAEISRGMVRCYLVGEKVEGFGHQEVNALVPGHEPGPRLYFPPDRADFQGLKDKVEREWLPQLMSIKAIDHAELPCLWDMDFMFQGDGHMLCEINISSVYPYPESAMVPLAKEFKRRIT